MRLVTRLQACCESDRAGLRWQEGAAACSLRGVPRRHTSRLEHGQNHTDVGMVSRIALEGMPVGHGCIALGRRLAAVVPYLQPVAALQLLVVQLQEHMQVRLG